MLFIIYVTNSITLLGLILIQLCKAAFYIPIHLWHVLFVLWNNLQKSLKHRKWYFYILTTIQLILGICFIVVYPLFVMVKTTSDYFTPARKLSRSELACLAPFYHKAFVQKIQIVVGMSLMSFIVRGENDLGFTLETTIYCHKDLGSKRLMNSVLRHEMVHSLQFKKLGLIGFLSDYYAYFIVNYLFNGRDPVKAYLAIPAEVEAYHFEKKENLKKLTNTLGHSLCENHFVNW